ncbi:MAG: DUF5686 and carboxypeptidase regulatory-like domain-containing protein [Sphingobacteriaceae bacterium]|nr:DUF5686 and carboxypeptidase regulatory-like domain-containing protein [Sphingobacteriaceae bacterium]
MPNSKDVYSHLFFKNLISSMFKVVFWCFLFCVPVLGFGQQTIEGKVVDAETQADMPFVTIKILGTQKGTSTNASGNFKLSYSQRIVAVQVSSMGYETQEIKIESNEKRVENLVFRMQNSSFMMNEIRIVPGENPALRIMRKAIGNKKQNHPDYISSYTCQTYNKVVCDLTKNKDAVAKPNTFEYKMAQKLLKMSKGKHFMITESVTERKSKAVGKLVEKVIATQVSGLSDPSFSVVPSTTQPFSIYDDYFKIVNQRYYSPLADGGVGKYFYNLEDTLYNEVDTVFVISYRPLRKSNFLGLKGVLHINTNQYAVQKVTVSPAIESPNIGKVYYEQEYTLLDNKQWFPSRFLYEANYQSFPSEYINAKVKMNTNVSKVKLNVPFEFEDNAHIQVQINEDASKKDKLFWKNHRPDTLAKEEQEIYVRMDSVRKAEHLDEKLKLAQSFVSWRYPVGWVDVNMNRLVDLNRHEGLRLGLGLHTNNELSKYFSVGGYFAYGKRDKVLKYGADIKFFLNREHELELNYSYMNDVVEPANSQYFYPRPPVLHNLTMDRADAVIRNEIELHGRFFKYLTADLSIRRETRDPLYPYTYEKIDNEGLMHNSEIRLEGRYAYKERFVQALGKVVSKGTDYPVLCFAYIKGLNALGGDYDYQKFSLGVEKRLRNIRLGETLFALEGGVVNGETPYFTLFNGVASYNKTQIFYIVKTFQTMRPYEFVSDRYAAFFMRHKFRALFHKFESQISKPEPVLYLSYGMGSLSELNKQQHVPRFNRFGKQTIGGEFRTMEKGFCEVGLGFDNLLRFNYGNLFYLGLGTSVFARVGNYTFHKPYDNFVHKLMITMSFN